MLCKIPEALPMPVVHHVARVHLWRVTDENMKVLKFRRGCYFVCIVTSHADYTRPISHLFSQPASSVTHVRKINREHRLSGIAVLIVWQSLGIVHVFSPFHDNPKHKGKLHATTMLLIKARNRS
ncbi:uncharacterized protein M421DRAFT_350405 [Didymella exigua CBS 183.55]|uniref:Uncharacterized protein n=1 Tax=Didymella exigua CBS 183.55 TaxID=1150837 RepID=A0A6A5R5J6_9PLEO|nr:uncharacterized protein M421DRAFT_350405 [Didymella exigua CBS 183.55]KAF1922679.1 hypothetical protein M421DRAFT_350405 [Didymella exigua CBS 183.55]